MNRDKNHLPPALATRHRGQAIILLVLILALGAGFLIFSAAGSRSTDPVRNQHTEAALALARDALLGRAVADVNRPGSLPCPDTNNDGSAELLVGNNCPSYIGRLPWRTLQLPDLRDGDGERLWYALSSAFRDDNSAQPINTDTLGTITVYAGNNTTVLRNNVAAVIFAPGAPMGSQARSSTQTTACPTTGTIIIQSFCASNYLESLSGTDNASASGPYISGPETPTFNDRLLVVDNVELMTPVEARAAREILTALRSYKSGSFCACYPWAGKNDNNGAANLNRRTGWVPLVSADTGRANDWSNATPPVTIPAWLIGNMWWKVFFYAVAPAQTYAHNSGSLTLDGVPGIDVVLISAGAATTVRSNFAADYINDAQNWNNDTDFITPTDSTSMNRDRLYTLP